jgi:hypothetical protein
MCGGNKTTGTLRAANIPMPPEFLPCRSFVQKPHGSLCLPTHPRAGRVDPFAKQLRELAEDGPEYPARGDLVMYSRLRRQPAKRS